MENSLTGNLEKRNAKEINKGKCLDWSKRITIIKTQKKKNCKKINGMKRRDSCMARYKKNDN